MHYFLTKIRNGLLTVICALIFAGGVTWYAAANFNGTQCSSGCTAFLDFVVSAVHIPGVVMVDAATGAVDIGAALKLDIESAQPAGTNRIGYVSDDVCKQKAKTNLPISQNGTSSVQLIALSGSTTIYVCSLSLIAAGATTVAITTGTGTACVTGNAAVIGSTTANIANSMAFPANGGMTLGNGGGTIALGAASGELCMILGTSVFVSGNLTYVQQ